MDPTEEPPDQSLHQPDDLNDHSSDDQHEALIVVTVQGTGRELSAPARHLIEDGRSRFKSVDVFDFVPCNYELLWEKLDALPRGRFCEYGSGWGIATGLAELLGFDALGIELAPELVAASRQLLAEHQLQARIEQGDYLARRDQADVVFTYAWPSHMRLIEHHFCDLAGPDSKLLYCHGQNDIRCKVPKSGLRGHSIDVS